MRVHYFKLHISVDAGAMQILFDIVQSAFLFPLKDYNLIYEYLSNLITIITTPQPNLRLKVLYFHPSLLSFRDYVIDL